MKYRDEKYFEALEKEVEALRLKVGLYSGQQQGGARAWGKTSAMASAVQTEELYRRARTEVVAEAGAGYGRVSLEALYLLPAEFTNVYQRLFLAALKESPGKVGEANPLVKKAPKLTKKGPGHENTKVKLGPSPTTGKMMYGEAEVLDRDPARGGGSARAGGRRHRDHWLIADERAFRLKKTVDDQLRELAEVVSQRLTSRAAEGEDLTGLNQSIQCTGCRRFLKSAWNYCPHCGAKEN